METLSPPRIAGQGRIMSETRHRRPALAAARQNDYRGSQKESKRKLSINVLARACSRVHLFYVLWLRRKRAFSWGSAFAMTLSVSLGQWSRGLRSVRSGNGGSFGGLRPVSAFQTSLNAHGWLALTPLDPSRERKAPTSTIKLIYSGKKLFTFKSMSS